MITHTSPSDRARQAGFIQNTKDKIHTSFWIPVFQILWVCWCDEGGIFHTDGLFETLIQKSVWQTTFIYLFILIYLFSTIWHLIRKVCLLIEMGKLIIFRMNNEPVLIVKIQRSAFFSECVKTVLPCYRSVLFSLVSQLHNSEMCSWAQLIIDTNNFTAE